MNDEIIDFLFDDTSKERNNKEEILDESTDLFRFLTDDPIIRRQDLSYVASSSTNPDSSVFTEFIEPDIFEE